MKTRNSTFFDADGYNKCNKIMLSSAILLFVIGTIFVFSADNSNISFASKGVKQMVFSFFGIMTAGFFTILNYRTIASEKFLKTLLIFLIVLLLPLAFCGAYYGITERANPNYITTKSGSQRAVGKELSLKIKVGGQNFGIWRINGAYRWIILGPLNFQPSVFIKIILIILAALKLSQIPDEEEKRNSKFYRQKGDTARFLFSVKDRLSQNREIILFTIATVVLVLLQPSNSVAVSIFLVVLVMFAMKNAKFIMKTIPLFLLAAVVLFISIWNINSNFRDRIMKGGDNYQSRQAILAIGSGGFFGLGIGNGEAKYNRLPEIENDYIFSIIAEETGFAGAVIFLGIYACFILMGFKTALSAEDSFAKLTAFGLTINYAISFMFHLFVNLGFISTGASLPFVSYGGTAIIADAIALGILLNISSSRYERIRV